MKLPLGFALQCRGVFDWCVHEGIKAQTWGVGWQASNCDGIKILHIRLLGDEKPSRFSRPLAHHHIEHQKAKARVYGESLILKAIGDWRTQVS